MAEKAAKFIQGEFRRLYDERYRIALPPEMVTELGGDEADYVLVKEREGCISLWLEEVWKQGNGASIQLVQRKMELNFLQQEHAKLQRLARLLSTRSRPVKLGQRGRLLVPEGFREFLAVEPNSEVMVIGAGVCIELWNPGVWKEYLSRDIGEFDGLLRELVR